MNVSVTRTEHEPRQSFGMHLGIHGILNHTVHKGLVLKGP